MSPAVKTALIVVPVIVLGIFAYTFRSAFMTPPEATSFINSSKIVWDAKTTVPETNVTFSYPKEGYYGQGVRIVNNQWYSSLPSFEEIESLYLISLPEQMGSQNTYVRIFELGDETNLEEVMQTFSKNVGMAPQGRYQEINGTRYFLQPSILSDEFKIYAYAAYAVVNERLLIVNFQGGFDGSDETVTPGLVTQFLSRLDFSCASDCSSNSAPITDAFRGEI